LSRFCKAAILIRTDFYIILRIFRHHRGACDTGPDTRPGTLGKIERKMVETLDKAGSQKPVSVDIMSMSPPRLRTPGYQKAPGASVAATNPTEQSPTTKADPKAQSEVQPAPASTATQQQAQRAAPADPLAQEQPASKAALSGIVSPVSQVDPSILAIPDTIQPFLATALPASAQPETLVTPHADYQSAQEQRTLDDNRYNISSLPIGFQALLYASTRSMVSDKLHNNSEGNAEQTEEEQKKKKDRELFEFMTTIDSMMDEVEENLRWINDSIKDVDTRIDTQRRNLSGIQADIKLVTRDIETDRVERTEIRHILDKYSKNLSDDRQNFRNAEAEYKAAKETEDPERDAILKKNAMDENEPAVRKIYVDAGLAHEYDIIKNGQRNPKQLEAAQDKIREAGLSANPDTALVKYLQQNDPTNPYLQTADAKKIIMEEARLKLSHSQYEFRTEGRAKFLEVALDRLDGRIEKNEQKLAELRKQENTTQAEIDKLTAERERLLKMKEESEEYRDKLTKLREKGDSPETRAELKAAETEYRSSIKPYVHDVFSGKRTSYSLTNETTTNTQSANGELSSAEPSGFSRTSTDSVAGLTATLSQSDKMAVGAFTRAAAPAAPAPVTPEAEQSLVATAAEPQRRAPAAGLHA
jgi:prefoldin subunit 5